MKDKLTLSISFIPIVYFGVKVFWADHTPIYLSGFIVSFIVNVMLLFITEKKVISQYWMGILFSSMFLNMIFYKMNIEAFINSWRDLNYYLLIPSICLSVLSCVVQTFRWNILLNRISSFRFSQLFPSVMIGHLGNHLLPAKAGEFIKSYHLGKAYNLDEVSIFSTVVVERIFDGILVLSFLLFFILGLNSIQSELMIMGWIGIFIYGGILLFIILFFKYKEQMVRLCQTCLPQGFSNIVIRTIKSFSDGLHILSNASQIIKAIGFSVLMWVVISMTLVPVILMFDFQLPRYAPFAILACISLGLTIPSAPGGIGIISFATIFSISILLREAGQEITETIYAEIVALSILINIVMVLPEIILGTFFTIKSSSKILSYYSNIPVYK